MSKVNWREILGWSHDQLEELRFSGFSFLREGHYKKALIFFEALVVLDPTSSYDFQTLGALYLQLGENKKALETLNKALTFDPVHEPTLLNKSKALFSLGLKREGLAYAKNLELSKDVSIAADAAALILSYV